MEKLSSLKPVFKKGGTVTAGNEALEGAPETVNADADGAGWFFKMTVADASELDSLMDEAAYKTYVEGLD